MNDRYDELKKLDIDKLLVRAIDQGNGASRQEIKNRQFAKGQPIPGLGLFLYQELGKIYGGATAKHTEERQPDGVDLEGIDISDDPDFICTTARRFRRDGFHGQNMRDPDRASAYIELAADNPRVMDELPASGQAFWKSADFHYRLWKKTTKAA